MAGDLAIRKAPLDVQAAEAIRRQITRGTMAPGRRLTEAALAAATGLSRGTIRSALALLERDGLVDRVPYTGWKVRGLTARDAWELYTLRSSLEGLGARLAAEALDGTRAEAIGAAFERLCRACAEDDRAEMAERDFELHQAIIHAAGNTRLAEQYRIVEHQVRMYIASSDALVDDGAALVEQHRPLVEALLARRPRTAERHAVQHNTHEGAKLVRHLRERERGVDPVAR